MKLPQPSSPPLQYSRFAKPIPHHRHDFTISGKPFTDHLKTTAYKEAIPEFKAILDQIGTQHGWTRADLKQRFSNKLYDELFFDDVILPPASKSLLPLPTPRGIGWSEALWTPKGLVSVLARLGRKVVGGIRKISG